MDSVVVFRKRRFEEFSPKTVKLGKALADQAVKLRVSTFLRTTFDDHRGQLLFLSRRKSYLHQLVTAFLEVNTRHDGQVDCPPEVDKICVALILDLQILLFLCFLVIRTVVTFILVIFIAPICFSQYFRLQLLIGRFMLFPFWIQFEDIQAILHINLIFQPSPMRDLILLFDQI